MRRQHGFTLIEALTVVAVVVVVAALGTVSISKVVNSAQEQKLSSDVETLNRSVAAYLGAGGDLSKAKSPAEVLTALKRSLVNSSRSPTLSGSKVDERLSFVMQNAAESGSSRSRVYWDKGTSRFVLAQS
ncbi:MAG TPA: prepilin-type N-terminal cleavage/methylation domain-containing protein, partial [Verrucomicrobiales bacterium]|nr:prepilin-type N-terminal cleavage/methylation domain-containing protein [Verrucomicrobiales bacterium]